MGAEKLASTITGVEMFRKILDRGEAGDNVGILLRGIEKTDIKRGMVICKPGSVSPHQKFEAEVYILKKEEGGRHTPFHNKKGFSLSLTGSGIQASTAAINSLIFGVQSASPFNPPKADPAITGVLSPS